MTRRVLILGSAPNLPKVKTWSFDPFEAVVVINNAWQIRPDWTHHIHPEDFPEDRRPVEITADQTRVTYQDYVPTQNRFGGFVYGGGTMCFTAAYWALAALSPDVIYFYACDMVYPKSGATHFYGTGAADPLRKDPTLRSLTAKAQRFQICAAEQGCALYNLSEAESVLPYRRRKTGDVDMPVTVPKFDPAQTRVAYGLERDLGYMVKSGRYWLEAEGFDLEKIDQIDAAWQATAQRPSG